MRTLTNGLLAVTLISASLVASNSLAVVYRVDRSFSSGMSTATLKGTVSLPEGYYDIQNSTPNPFTAVNLTLTVDASSYHLTHALTDVITGTGQFLIDASPTELKFVASGDAGNPADLVFSDNLNPNSFNRYSIGSNGNPEFQVAHTEEGSVFGDVRFPDVFGTAIPEPSSIALIGVAMLVGGGRRRFRRIAG
jgi:hypothetical protein